MIDVDDDDDDVDDDDDNDDDDGIYLLPDRKTVEKWYHIFIQKGKSRLLSMVCDDPENKTFAHLNLI